MRNLKTMAVGMLLLSLAGCNMFQSKEGQYFDADGNEIPKEKAEAMIAASKSLVGPNPEDENDIVRQQQIRRLIAKKKAGQQLTQEEATYLAKNRGEVISDAERRDINRDADEKAEKFIRQQAEKNKTQTSQE